MSEDSEIDGRFIPVEDAIRLTVEGDAGSLIPASQDCSAATWARNPMLPGFSDDRPRPVARTQRAERDAASKRDQTRQSPRCRLIRPFQQRGAVRHLLEPFRGV